MAFMRKSEVVVKMEITDDYNEDVICPHCCHNHGDNPTEVEMMCDRCSKWFKIEEFNGFFATIKLEDY